MQAVYLVAYGARNSAFTDAQLPLSKPGTLSRVLAQDMALSRRQRKNSSQTRSSFVPVRDAGCTSETFDELMGRNCFLVLAAVEERDVGRATNFIGLGEGLSDIGSSHDEVGNVEEAEQTSLRKQG